MLESYEGEVTEKVHDPRDVRPLGVDDMYYRIIIAKENNALVSKIVTPELASDDDSKEFLPSNADTWLREELVGGPATLEPFVSKNSPIAKSA